MKKISRHIKRIIVSLTLLLVSEAIVAAPVWEKITTIPVEASESSGGADSYEVKLSDNAIILTLSEKTSVKVFTILGQLVAEKQLEAGTWRLPITARGIYILKVGTSTRRVTI